MIKELIMNVSRHETRIALLEDGDLVEFYIERQEDTNIIGNICKGRIVRILPGMQAAFVDIGLERAAFLSVADVQEDVKIYKMLMGINGDGDENGSEDERIRANDARRTPIEDILSEGQEILVQVVKEPIGSKGARVSSLLSLPGRYLVFLPGANHVGISRKIEDEETRERLKKLVLEAKPHDSGFIIRTASASVKDSEILADMGYLSKLWEKIERKGAKVSPPSLIHQDIDIILRAMRDIISADVGKIVVDSPDEHAKILSFMGSLMPQMKESVELYNEEEPIFDHFGIEVEIDEMLRENVWLKSGGYIVIQATEALTAIDVNTGRFTGKKSLEETILKTNLEAAKEIACQLRLRNIGGIIIIDFIDMDKEEDREKIYNTLQEALKKGRAITRVSRISELGLLEMTRKRIRNSIVKVMCTPCDYCEGQGYLKSKESICYQIIRGIKKKMTSGVSGEIIVQANPAISDMLLDDFSADINEFEKRCKTSVTVKANPSFHLEIYHIQ